MPKRFEGDTVLITGAGGGIGLAVVEIFAQQGATIIAADINQDSLNSIQQRKLQSQQMLIYSLCLAISVTRSTAMNFLARHIKLKISLIL